MVLSAKDQVNSINPFSAVPRQLFVWFALRDLLFCLNSSSLVTTVGLN